MSSWTEEELQEAAMRQEFKDGASYFYHELFKEINLRGDSLDDLDAEGRMWYNKMKNIIAEVFQKTIL